MGHTILIVDDEPGIREYAREVLETQGYTVLDTGDPRQALRIAKEQQVDLLLTDVVMPLMKGPELADHIQAASTSTKVLLMSGVQTSDAAHPGWPFISKPFQPDTLADHVGRALAQQSS
jgi:DNA-binding NtrC family response regulator